MNLLKLMRLGFFEGMGGKGNVAIYLIRMCLHSALSFFFLLVSRQIMSNLLHIQTNLLDCEQLLHSLRRSFGVPFKHFEFLQILKKAQFLLMNIEAFVRTQSAFMSRKMPTVLLLSIFEFLPLDGFLHTSWVCKAWYNVWKVPMASQLIAGAQFKLALSYDLGKGEVVKDLQKAIHLYRASAEKGNAKAQLNLALIYSNGTGVTIDLKESIRLFQLSANQGNAKAQFNLAVFYDTGRGVARDMQEAVRLYQLSADRTAQFSLAVCYEQGDGVEVDIKDAIRWYELAAQQGDAEAQLNLAEFYEKGKSIPRNVEKAIYWYRLSATQGGAVAQYYLKLLTNQE